MVKKSLPFIMALIFIIGVSFHGFAQDLCIIAEQGVQHFPGTPTARLSNTNDGVLIDISQQELIGKGIRFSLLDDDTQTGVYYWVELPKAQSADLHVLCPDNHTRILWRSDHTALIRSESYCYLRKLPPQYFGRPLQFLEVQKSAEPLALSRMRSDQESYINAILDSVNIDRLTTTLKHISGDEPYWIDGHLDSIMTRYSSSKNPDIQKARRYLIQTLEDYGYDVKPHNFTWVMKKITQAPDDPQIQWANVNHKIYYSKDGGETWLLQYRDPDGWAIRSIFSLDQNTCYAVGGRGLILKTINGGADWAVLQSGVSQHLFQVYFQKPALGWIRTGSGLLLRTSDGGQNWAWEENGVQNITAEMKKQSLLKKEKKIYVPLEDFQNIVAVKTGVVYPKEYYLIGAHYDSYSNQKFFRAPGADDNGSGTCAVLEAAKVLSQYNFEYSIKFVLFDIEEEGLFGSHAFARDSYMRNDIIKGLINLDMIGYDSDNDGVFHIHSGSMAASQYIGYFIKNNIVKWNLPLSATHFTFDSSLRSDHSSFWDNGYPAVFLIEDSQLDFNLAYHLGSDQVYFINFPYYYQISRLAIGSLASLAGIVGPLASVEAALFPESFQLQDPYPNPFNSQIHFDIDLPINEWVNVSVYNLMGQKVKELVNRTMQQGRHHLSWDGKTLQNNACCSGVYFIRLESHDQSQLKKVILVR